MNYLKLAAIAIIALALGACASVTSRYGNSVSDQKGQAYYLPKGLIQVNVSESNGQFNVVIAGPVMVADADFRFHADLRKAALSDNNAIVAVDPRTQLLTSAQITSTGQAGEIIENFNNVVGAFGSDSPDGTYITQIFSGLYEVTDLASASRDASRALLQYYARRCGENGELAADPYAGEDCARYQALGVDQPGMVVITAQSPTGASTANASIDKCGSGLCYRPLVPVKIRAVVAGTFVTEDYYMIPDTTTVSYYTLPAGFFATQEYNLTFDQGVLVTADQKQQSELLGFSRLPVEVLKAIISAPVEAIRGDRGSNGGDDNGDGGSNFPGEAGFGEGGPGDDGTGAGLPSYFKSRTIQLGSPLVNNDQAGFRGQGPGTGAFPGSANQPSGQSASGTTTNGQPPVIIIERVIEPYGESQNRRRQRPRN